MALTKPNHVHLCTAPPPLGAHMLADVENGYGPELCPAPYMQNPSAWRVTSSGSVAALASGFPVGYSSGIVATSGDGTYDRLEQAADISGFKIGHAYRVKALVKPLNNSGAEQGFFAFQFTNGAEEQLLNGTEWQWLETTVDAKYSTGRTRIYVCRLNGNPADALHVAYLSIKEVL